ncbi:MAG: mechanosensitive ion channel family protein [Elainellaceae cyanobacterium]
MANRRRRGNGAALKGAIWATLACLVVLLTTAPTGLAQEAELPPEAAAPATSAEPATGSYFADVLVRGRPIFQVGGLADIDALARAAIINRRTSSLLSSTDEPGKATVELGPEEGLATISVNNRVLMTVTQQDADDYGLGLEALAERWTEELNQAFDKPPLFIDVAQRLNTTVRQLGRDAVDKLPALLGALVVVLVTWAVASLVRYAAFTWAQQTEGDRSTEVLVGRLGYGAVWVLGSVIALGVMGLEFGALLGALGLTSVAIGFSLKDVLSNYISGVILLAARPFRLGDQVVIDEYEGTITQIQLRATTMRTYDGRLVYIPNQEVFQASVTNNTASPLRRSSVIVGIDYDEDISAAKTVILQGIEAIKGVDPDRPIDVLVNELAASTVNIEVRFWVDSHRGEFLETTSRVAQDIKESLEQANISMPTEIYTLSFRNNKPINLNAMTQARITEGQAEGTAVDGD